MPSILDDRGREMGRLDVVLDVVGELVKQSHNVGKRIVGRFRRGLAKLFHRVVQLRVDLTLNV